MLEVGVVRWGYLGDPSKTFQKGRFVKAKVVHRGGV